MLKGVFTLFYSPKLLILKFIENHLENHLILNLPPGDWIHAHLHHRAIPGAPRIQ
jgi:hypothetical protein